MTSNKSSGNKVGDSSMKSEDEMREEMKEKANGEVQRCEKGSSLLENHVVSSEKLTTGNNDEKGKVEKAEKIEKGEEGMLEHEGGEVEETNRERDTKGTTKGGGNEGKAEEGDGGIGGVETTIPSSATSIKVVVKSNLYNASAYIERTIDDGPEEEGDDSVFESCPNENENDNENETTGKTTTVSAIPRWLSEEEEADPGSEGCSGMQEPPATPVARDELALRRHRFFSDLLQATQNSSEHRVRFDPLGPMVHAG